MEETKNQPKNEIRMKENKEMKSIQLEDKNYEELDYELSLCKESRFNPFCG